MCDAQSAARAAASAAAPAAGGTGGAADAQAAAAEADLAQHAGDVGEWLGVDGGAPLVGARDRADDRMSHRGSFARVSVGTCMANT